MQLFIDFTEEYNKVYESGKDRNHEATMFYKNLKKIRNLNNADASSPFGVTNFSDMSDDEFEKIYMMTAAMDNITNSSMLNQEQMGKRLIADHVDWTGPIPKCFD